MIIRTRSSRSLARASVLGTASVLLIVACSAADEALDDEVGPDGVPRLGETRLQLERAADCDDLLARIQDGVLVQLGERADALKRGEDGYVTPGVAIGNGVAEGDFARPSGATGQGPTGSGSTANTGAPPGEAGADPIAQPAPSPDAADNDGGGFSGTTVQVKDVDEADIVKTDGDRIFLLHGGTLFVIGAWPAAATEVLGSTPIDGSPAEMFVKDGKAVVFSRVYGDLSAASTAPDPYGYDAYGSYTKLTVLDVAGAQPSVLRESYIEGDYNSARRHDDLVRAVVQDGFKIPNIGSPNIEYRDVFGQPFPQADIDAQVDAWLERTVRSIRSTELGDWLPREFEKEGGDLVAVAPRCADHYSPDPGLTQSGVTSVVSLDLADVTAPLGGATILGNAERVYSNEDVVLITQTDYRYSYDASASLQTIIHRFDIAGSATSYTASGAVPGSIHDQFSLDERDGIIRVSATEQPWGRGGGVTISPGVAVDAPAPAPASNDPAGASAMAAPEQPVSDSDEAIAPAPEPEPRPAPTPVPQPQVPTSVSRVLTLGTSGDSLEVLGSTEDFGETEQIFATRFIGDRGYVVTFRRTDPLFVIDLSDAADPHVVGELHIPGFSNYLFPLDDDHLFSIGRDATDEGVVQGLALQIFDVSDPTAPALAFKYAFPDVGDSPANVDHRAIAFHPDRGIVAFPHTNWQTGESTLEVFELSVESGFEPLGGMGMSDELDLDQCLSRYFGYTAGPELEELRAQVENDPAWQREVLTSCRYGHVFRRGLFRDDFVYGISNTGISVYDFTEMAAGAVSDLRLPAEVYTDGGFAGGGSSGGRAVQPGIATAPPPVDPEPAPAAGGQGAGGAAGTGAAGAGGASGGSDDGGAGE